MESEQRSTEEEHFYEADQSFIDGIRSFPARYRIPIVNTIDYNVPMLPEKDEIIQTFGGVIKDKDPFFFEVQFIYDIADMPIFLEISEIESDDYLDHITHNTAFKPYGEQDTDKDNKG